MNGYCHFSFKAADWKGIFGEIESYLGNDFYNINFVGKQEDMNILMDNAPENISIFFKPPVVPKKKHQVPISDNISSVSNSLKENIPHDMNDTKGKAMGLINGAKKDYYEMQQKDSGLLFFGKIAAAVAIVGCVIFIIKMSRLFMLFSLVPVIIFAVLAFNKQYKSLAISTIIVSLVLGIASWIIITIRWNMFWNGLSNDIDDAMEGVNEALDILNGK